MTDHETAWLAGVLDVCGCWSVAVAGGDGTLCSTLRLQVAGSADLVGAIACVSQIGTVRSGDKKHHWSVAKSVDLRALILRVQPFSRVRSDLYRRLLDWPILAPGERGRQNRRVQELRYSIASDLGLLDPQGHPRDRAKKRRRSVMKIKTLKRNNKSDK